MPGRGPSLLALTAGVAALAGCGSSGDGATTGATSPQASAPPATTAATTTATTQGAPDGTCRDVPAPAPRDDGDERAPRKRLDPDAETDVVFRTSCGSFTVRLDVRQDPRTAASVAALARSGFYDGTTFHRVIPGFVAQGGDPRGDGSGTAGYTVVEPPPASETYERGTVAMAKRDDEAPGTSSSQFFITLGDTGLPPDYAVAGRVTQGYDTTVEAIAALGREGVDGPPTRPVVVESARVVQR